MTLGITKEWLAIVAKGEVKATFQDVSGHWSIRMRK
jgi:hypothetical protein